ncbi:MAG: hypothetical protein HFG33_02360 [Bacilli bacterium]|nr:hypothetical protein [Bacilli bacterium]
MDRDLGSKIDKLKEAIETAERFLEETEDEESGKTKRKRKRVNKALEKAYDTLNKKTYVQSEIDKRTDEVWKSLMDEENYLAIIIFIFGFVLSGTIIFTVFQAYSFIQTNWDPERKDVELTKELNDLISVDYTEKNIISLYDQMTVPDKVGLKNPPQEFTISNDSSKVGSLNYLVHYSVNLVLMNDPNAKLIDKRFIKYKYSYKDSNTGKTFESNVETLADLEENPDGSLLLTKGVQLKDAKTDFKVTFWISSLAQNDQQGRTFTFAFNVNAAVAKS